MSKKDNSQALPVVIEWVYGMRENFMAALSEPGMKFEREAEYAIQLFSQKRNSFLLDTAMRNPESLRTAFQNVASIGLSLNPAEKEAYLVPRNGEICLDISARGMLHLAMSCEAVIWGQAKLVHEKDVFRPQGLDKQPLWEYDAFGERGEIVGVFVCVKLPNGDYLTETMTVSEVNEIRDRSEGYQAFLDPSKPAVKQSPWHDFWGEMAKKSVVKRAYKQWPKAARLDKAIHYLNTEGGEGLIDINQPPAGKKEAEMYNGPDVNQLLAEGYKTKTDKDALDFWLKNKHAFKDWPGVYNRFKDGIIEHRAKMADAGQSNTIDASLREVEPEPTNGVIPRGMEDFFADMEAAAQDGLDDFEIIWGGLSKSTKDKLIASGAYDHLIEVAKGRGA